MTLNEMISRVRFYCDEQSELNLPNSDIILSLNVGQSYVHAEIVKFDVGWFEKPAEINPNGNPKGVTPQVGRYLLPADFYMFRRVEYKATGLPLIPIDLNEKSPTDVLDLATMLMGTSNGHGYYRSGGDMVIDPTPTSAFEVSMTYVYTLPELTPSTDGSYVSEIPSRFHNMICIAAAIDALIKDEAPTAQMQQLKSKLNWHQAQLETTIGAWQSQEPKMVGGAKFL